MDSFTGLDLSFLGDGMSEISGDYQSTVSKRAPEHMEGVPVDSERNDGCTINGFCVIA
jgi:Fungal mating-type pheromone